MNQNISIPISIVLAGLFIAAGIFFGGGGYADAAGAERPKNAHIYGDQNAPVTIVEFSDFECPFCARLHPTLQRIVDESNGRIKWEYRNLPLPSHPQARPAAKAAECVAKIAGNDAYWSFIDRLFIHQQSLGNELYVQEAATFGIAETELSECMADPKIAALIESDVAAAVAHGGSGTPFSVVVFEDGTTKPVSGALPYEQWQILLGL